MSAGTATIRSLPCHHRRITIVGAEAAVIAIPDEKWGERPLACVVFKHGQQSDRAALNDHLLQQGVARWQRPERYEVID